MIKAPDLDLKSLRTFVVVAEELHFTRAAERLGIAQPPLSQQIKRLEDKVGYPLFERGKRRVQLSAAGRSLLGTARLLLDQANLGLEAARRAARGETGRLRVAFPTSMALTFVSLILRAYVARFPEVELQIRELATTQQVDALQAGLIDVGFLRNPREQEMLCMETVFREPFVAMLPSSHRLCAQSAVGLHSLRGERFVLFPPEIGADFHRQILRLCEDAGFLPNIVQAANDWQTIASLVQAGLGVSIGPACVSRLQLDEVAYRPLADVVATTEVSMCWRTDSSDPLVQQFREVSREISCSVLQRPASRSGGRRAP